MQSNPKKIKAIIFLCLVVIITLLAFSIFLVVKVNHTKNELAKQNSQISQLEEIIRGYENLPKGDNNEIISKE